MQNFDGISFVWALLLLGTVALIYGIRAYIGFRNVAQDAEADYAFKQKENMLDPRLSKDGYIRAYRRFHNPRALGYMAAGITAILLLTAPALSLLQILLNQVWIWSGRSRVFEPGYLVWQFFIFFAVIGIWAFIAYVTARQFHKNAPTSLRDEILKEIE